MEKPRTSADARAALARQLRADVGCRERFPDPLAWAFGLGIDVRIAEPADPPELYLHGSVAVYRWNHDPGERGWQVYLAVAHVLLRRADLPRGAADVCLLACEIALPSTWIGMTDSRITLLQRHVPVRILGEWIARVASSGP